MATSPNTNKAHAKYSASGASRWLACAGSIALSDQAPPQPESKYAAEGTLAHECLEVFLKNGKDTCKKTDKFLRLKHPEDMVTYAREAAETIWEIAGDNDLLCETKVNLEFVRPGMFGTVDAAVIDLFGTLHVFDFKYGAGIAVEVKDNPQLIYYALGLAFAYDFNFKDVKLHVLQPRANHGDGPNRSWIISVSELMEWEHRFRLGVEACEDPLAGYNAGSHCKFCPAKTICTATADQAFHQAQIDFSPVADSAVNNVTSPHLPEPVEFTPLELPAILKALPKIETWIDAVRSHAQSTLENGGSIEGFKLVAKRSTRKWLDVKKATDQAFKKWREEVFTTAELLSPAQLEKKFGKAAKEFTKNHTTDVVPEGFTMVESSDPRPEAGFSPEQAFGDWDWAKEELLQNTKEKIMVSEYDWKKKRMHQKFARGSRKAATKQTKKKRK